MRDVKSINGVIVSAQGLSPGPAGGITYTIDVNWPDGTVRTLQNQVPHQERWSNVDVTAVAAGSGVQGMIVDGVIQWNFREIPAMTPCVGAP